MSTERVLDAHEHADSFRKGIFAPVADELDARDLPVEGEIPADLHGLFARNGPNPRFEPRGRYHWFDGDGMVHAVRFEGGHASYVNRWVRTKAFALEEEAGRALWRGIMEPVELDNPHGPVKDTANTDLAFHAGKLLALFWLTGTPYELALPGLETRGRADFGTGKPVRVASHPKVDPRTGELAFMDYSPLAPPYLQYGTVSRDGRLLAKVPIEVPGPRLFHDIAITERFTIFLDFPMLWSTDKLQAGKRKVVFDTSLPSRFGLIPRHGGTKDVRWFEASPCYVYHTVNAWEEGDEVVFVGCRIENPVPKKGAYDGRYPRLDFLELAPFLHRWRFNLATGAVREERLDDLATEFPRMRDDLLGRRSRFSYHAKLAASPLVLFEGTVKYDLETGARSTHAFGPGRFGSETVFAPRSGGSGEDDGWLLSLVANAEGPSELEIWDARRMEAPPVARVKLPQHVPLGFHACWVPGV
jgi:carotenoid cleavage dioxygenase-like enzyme